MALAACLPTGRLVPGTARPAVSRRRSADPHAGWFGGGGAKSSSKNNSPVFHLIFTPSSSVPQSRILNVELLRFRFRSIGHERI